MYTYRYISINNIPEKHHGMKYKNELDRIIVGESIKKDFNSIEDAHNFRSSMYHFTGRRNIPVKICIRNKSVYVINYMDKTNASCNHKTKRVNVHSDSYKPLHNAIKNMDGKNKVCLKIECAEHDDALKIRNAMNIYCKRNKICATTEQQMNAVYIFNK